jgi:hypothetical protein
LPKKFVKNRSEKDGHTSSSPLGETSPWGEGQSALTLSLAWWPLFNRICTVTLAQSQITMSKQSNMPVEASPKASLIVIENRANAITNKVVLEPRQIVGVCL